MTDTIFPFFIEVAQADLDDLAERLGRTRLPDAIPGTNWDYGIEIDYLRSLLRYWRTDYDWRKWERRLNELDHFKTVIDRQEIHFVHVRSPHGAARPLLMVHGWPGSIVEFLGTIERLTTPEKFGGRAEDAFHLVLPSLPGYGFSAPPCERGWGPARTAAAFTELMARLGYSRYGLQGGDWGAIVTSEMAKADRGHIIGLHTNMPMALAPFHPVALTEDEQADVADIDNFNQKELAYALLQGSKPQTIGVSLVDSPAGLAAWIAEKFRTWSDCGGSLESAIDRDLLLTNIMIYWLTASGASAARFYFEFFQSEPTWASGRIEVPTGVARFPKEMNRPPRAWVELNHNLVHWTAMSKGGHFAALEQPELLANDILAFFSKLTDGAQATL